MPLLGQARKREVFTQAVRYGITTNSARVLLHDISTEEGRPIWWTQSGTDAALGITLEVELDEGLGYQITTASPEQDPALVGFVYAHEFGHILLDHLLEGAFLFGWYTRREAEADAFAFAYLYVTAEKGLPGIGKFPLSHAARAMMAKNEREKGFFWGQQERLGDIAMIREILKQEECRQPANGA
jgi:hypothetical protein